MRPAVSIESSLGMDKEHVDLTLSCKIGNTVD
jgi:hypothetical protein